MTNCFCVVSRTLDGEVKYVGETDDFIEACAIQLGTLIGVGTQVSKNFLKQEDVETIKKNLQTYGRDRIADEEEEVYIFILPAKNKMK